MSSDEKFKQVSQSTTNMNKDFISELGANPVTRSVDYVYVQSILTRIAVLFSTMYFVIAVEINGTPIELLIFHNDVIGITKWEELTLKLSIYSRASSATMALGKQSNTTSRIEWLSKKINLVVLSGRA